jgi:hypothetical protein
VTLEQSVPVDETPVNAFIAALVDSISSRTDSEADCLASALMGRHWPGGGADRTHPTALDWVRRWGPQRSGHALPSCSCAEGHCGLCN